MKMLLVLVPPTGSLQGFYSCHILLLKTMILGGGRLLTTGAARLGAGAACLLPRKHLDELGVITNVIFALLV